MNVGTQFSGNLSNSFWDILVFTKVVDWPTDIAIPRASVADKRLCSLPQKDKWKKEGWQIKLKQ